MLSRVAEVDMEEAAFFDRICESFGVDPALERSEADAAGLLCSLAAAASPIEEDDDSEDNLRRIFDSLVADEKQQGEGCNGCGAQRRLHDRNAIFGAVLRWFPLKCASPGHAFERVRRCSTDSVDFLEFQDVIRDATANVAA